MILEEQNVLLILYNFITLIHVILFHVIYFQGESDEMMAEVQMAEDKATRSMTDAARLADELRLEQEYAQQYERDRKLLECQCKDAQVKLDEAESNALKGGKKAMNKMETRIRELQSEMEAENRHGRIQMDAEII